MTTAQDLCDRAEHEGLAPRAHLEAHAHWGCTSQAQMAALIDAAIAEATQPQPCPTCDGTGGDHQIGCQEGEL